MIRRTFIDDGDHFFVNEDGHLVMQTLGAGEQVIIGKKNLQAFTEFLLGEVTERKLEGDLNGR